MEASASLRDQLSAGVLAAGVYDALSTRLAERAGFEALFISGYALEASLLAAPDLGLLSMSEVLDQARRIVLASESPVICDIDTGFGGINNVWRTVREMERIGVAAVQLEDQVNPKRCPYLGGRVAVDRGAAIARVRAAVEARGNDGPLVFARSDADGISLDEVTTRCNLFLEAGADAVVPLFMTVDGHPLEQFSPAEQMELHARVAGAVKGPTVCVEVPDGYTPQDMLAAGYSVVEIPVAPLEAAANALDEAYRAALPPGGDTTQERRHLAAAGSLLEILGLPDYVDREARSNAIAAAH